MRPLDIRSQTVEARFSGAKGHALIPNAAGGSASRGDTRALNRVDTESAHTLGWRPHLITIQQVMDYRAGNGAGRLEDPSSLIHSPSYAAPARRSIAFDMRQGP